MPPRVIPRAFRMQMLVAAARNRQMLARGGRASKVAGAGVAALGGVAMGLVAWPLMDGYIMPWMAAWSFSKAGAKAFDDAELGATAERSPEAADMMRRLQEAVSSGSGSLMMVQEGILPYKELLAVGRGRPLCAVDLSCVNDPCVLIWSLLHQMYSPLGSLGTAINSYVRAVYIAAALLTGNEGIEHTDFMFYLAFLDYLSNALRAAPKETRPLLVIRNIDELHARAAGAEADGDKSRAMQLRRSASTLLCIAERICVTEGIADCIIVSDAPPRFQAREGDGHRPTLYHSARAIAA